MGIDLSRRLRGDFCLKGEATRLCVSVTLSATIGGESEAERFPLADARKIFSRSAGNPRRSFSISSLRPALRTKKEIELKISESQAQVLLLTCIESISANSSYFRYSEKTRRKVYAEITATISEVPVELNDLGRTNFEDNVESLKAKIDALYQTFTKEDK